MKILLGLSSAGVAYLALWVIEELTTPRTVEDHKQPEKIYQVIQKIKHYLTRGVF